MALLCPVHSLPALSLFFFSDLYAVLFCRCELLLVSCIVAVFAFKGNINR